MFGMSNPCVIARLIHFCAVTVPVYDRDGVKNSVAITHSAETDMELLVEPASAGRWARADSLGKERPVVLYEGEAQAMAKRLSEDPNVEVYAMTADMPLDGMAKEAVAEMLEAINLLNAILEFVPPASRVDPEDIRFKVDELRMALRGLHLARFFVANTKPRMHPTKRDPDAPKTHGCDGFSIAGDAIRRTG